MGENMMYGDLVEFRGARLFSGAIDLDWVFSNPALAIEAAEGYIFHGKAYHAGQNTQRTLTDTISFTEEILGALTSSSHSSNGNTILGIAGYGAGKSHFALALSFLLSQPNSSIADRILSNIGAVDEAAKERISVLLKNDGRPFLVIPVNGMKNQSLFQVVLESLEQVLRGECAGEFNLIKYDPEIAYIGSIIPIIDASIRNTLFRESGIEDIDDFAKAVSDRDSVRLGRLKSYMLEKGFHLQRLQVNESIKSLLIDVAKSLCGEGRRYRGLLLAFDEFGKYLSFASEKEQVAGMGCMQDLFEAVQSVAAIAPTVLLGLSQLDLQEYSVSLGDSASKNNFQRYVTRFSMAKRYYLSVCFESLIANLIETKSVGFIPKEEQIRVLLSSMHQHMLQFFPASKNSSVWASYQDFYRVVFCGCWPLSPLTIWVISYITSQNSILQQRTGLSLIETLFERFKGQDYVDNRNSMGIPAVELYNSGLRQEFLAAERMFTSRSQEASLFEDVLSRYGTQISDCGIHVLQAIVLSRKLMSRCSSVDDAVLLIRYLSGESRADVEHAISMLTTEYNVIRFDSMSRLFELVNSGMSLSQFSNMIQKRVIEKSESEPIGKQYERIALMLNYRSDFMNLRSEFLSVIECHDFSDAHRISSLEWCYESRLFSSYEYLDALRNLLDDMKTSPDIDYNKPKGRLVYFVLPYNVDVEHAMDAISSLLHTGPMRPVIVQLLPDENKLLNDSFSEYDVIQGLNSEEQAEYGNFIKTRSDELLKAIKSELTRLREKKLVVKPIDDGGRISKSASAIFERIYPKAVSLNCDGFSTAKSTAPSTIMKFINILSDADASWSLNFLNQSQIYVNRAQSLLNKGGWGCFDKSGNIAEYPDEPSLNEMFRKYDNLLNDNQSGLLIWDMVRELVMPPYGMSRLGASLAMMVYLNARAHYIEIRDSEQKIGLPVLESKKYFDSKLGFFVEKAMSTVKIVKTVKDDGKWKLLLERIQASTSSADLMSYGNDMDDYLYMRHLQIPTVLMPNYDTCKKKIDACKSSNQIMSEAIAKHGRALSNHIALKSFPKACHEFHLLLEIYDKHFKEFEPVEDVKKEYTELKNSFIRFCNANLSKWEKAQQKLFLAAKDSEVASLFGTYNELAEIYKILNGENAATQIVNFQKKMKGKRSLYNEFMEQFAPLQDKVNQIREAIVVHGISSASIVDKYRNQLEDVSSVLNHFDQKLLKLDENRECVDALKEKLEDLDNCLDNSISENTDELNAVLNSSVSDINDIRDMQNRIDRLLVFFRDDAAYCEVLKSCQNELKAIESVYQKLSSRSLSENEIDFIVEDAKATVPDAAELRFDFYGIISRMADEAKALLCSDMMKWVENMSSRANTLHHVDGAKEYLFILDQCPARFKSLCEPDVAKLRATVQRFISDKKVDYICQLYCELTTDERKEVLSRLDEIK